MNRLFSTELNNRATFDYFNNHAMPRFSNVYPGDKISRLSDRYDFQRMPLERCQRQEFTNQRSKKTERTNPSVLERVQIDLFITTIRACFRISLAVFDSMRTLTTLKTIAPPFRKLLRSSSTLHKEQSPWLLKAKDFAKPPYDIL